MKRRKFLAAAAGLLVGATHKAGRATDRELEHETETRSVAKTGERNLITVDEARAIAKAIADEIEARVSAQDAAFIDSLKFRDSIETKIDGKKLTVTQTGEGARFLNAMRRQIEGTE